MIDTSKIKAGDWVQINNGDWFEVITPAYTVNSTLRIRAYPDTPYSDTQIERHLISAHSKTKPEPDRIDQLEQELKRQKAITDLALDCRDMAQAELAEAQKEMKLLIGVLKCLRQQLAEARKDTERLDRLFASQILWIVNRFDDLVIITDRQELDHDLMVEK